MKIQEGLGKTGTTCRCAVVRGRAMGWVGQATGGKEGGDEASGWGGSLAAWINCGSCRADEGMRVGSHS